MTIKHFTGRTQIHLAGVQGNLYCLVKYTRDFGRHLGWSKDKTESTIAEMRNGDYIGVFKREFGHLVDICECD